MIALALMLAATETHRPHVSPCPPAKCRSYPTLRREPVDAFDWSSFDREAARFAELYAVMRVRPLTDAELAEAEAAGDRLNAHYHGQGHSSSNPSDREELGHAWVQQWKLRAVAGVKP